MPLWVCMASAVIRAPSRSNGSSRSLSAGISLDLSATRRCPTTTPPARPGAARRRGAGLSPVRAPRMVSSSTAITLRPAMVPVRVKNHDVRRASRPTGSRSFRTRLIVDSLGRARPSSRPRAPRSAGSRSAACSHIAVRLRHPASIPVTARHPAETRGWRTPRRSLGSVTPSRTFFRGRRDRAVVADDGMAARPPGGEVDSSTAHRHRPGRAAPAPTRRQPRTSDHPPPTLPTPWVSRAAGHGCVVLRACRLMVTKVDNCAVRQI